MQNDRVMLNIGCGRVFHEDWINLDVAPADASVVQLDASKGLPFKDGTVDVCYSSHVLEHIAAHEAGLFLSECARALKPGGVVRIVVPDLEMIVREYSLLLHKLNEGDDSRSDDYDWIMLELFDQVEREKSGGEMAQYLLRPDLPNREFIRARIGAEAESYWKPGMNEAATVANVESIWRKLLAKSPSHVMKKLRERLAKSMVRLIAGESAADAFQVGLFRASGEIHRWMYDRYSLARLLKQAGFVDVVVCDAETSRISNFAHYGLDSVEGRIRKADSLFVEGIRS